ncbi:MAG: hypothetical protein HZT43_08165 [Exiguobacterium profundum]|nr:MAG: hypothetical protein HZT43_08165 [Exiguobacterium profundum]
MKHGDDQAGCRTGGERGHEQVPAEAGHTYDEVKEADMAALRHEMAEAAALHQWELIDGIDFPYDKCA